MAKSKILMVFPSFIYCGSLQADKAKILLPELAREISILPKIDAHGVRWSRKHYKNGYSSYSSLDKLHHTSPNFLEIEKILRSHVKKYVSALNWQMDSQTVQMTTCWANSMGYGTHHSMHTHPKSLLSGVLYVTAPKGSSPFKLEDPRMGYFMSSPARKDSAPENQKPYIHIEPKAGDFLLFESWMRHEVPPHLGKKPRLSISFNYEE